ncbi:MAG TPA: type II toxin-antitoxin system HipA family toxinoxin YjjJ [Elusimicrobia bacterium]|nr:type II toxin-antitoxin system HipA family toxinoxin YjjJ [Elusimicrobiota bacterium]
MPSGPRIDYTQLTERFRRFLRRGVTNALDACRSLEISQPTFSRVLSLNRPGVLSVGKARKTRYALRREIPNVGRAVVVHQINEEGEASELGTLHGIEPDNGFYFESSRPGDCPSRFYEDLPYFLNDLRPAGFLGRLIPQKYPELDAPKDISRWSADDCLKYLTRYGSDLIGNLILGDEAFRKYLKSKSSSYFVSHENRSNEYPRMASAVLEYGDPGSSAGGEQPKFSAVVGDDRTAVLVKFSPKIDAEVGRRVADLLICEAISSSVLGSAGRKVASSEILFGNDQVFLEVRRFDRAGRNGRRGLISLETLDAGYAGRGTSWVDRARALREEGIIGRDDYDEVRWRELYGHLIGNTDMHAANISFFMEWPRKVRLAPIYDMLPMLYIPRNDQIIERDFVPPLPSPGDSDIWLEVWETARRFWRAVSGDGRVSAGFRAIAGENFAKLDAQEELGRLLPK